MVYQHKDSPAIFKYKKSYLLLCALFAGAAFLFLHAAYYYPFLSDDALISLRYAERLLEGNGLTWTDGKPVEGYSNLLWILLISAMGLLGIDLIDASRLLGFLGMSTVVYSMLRYYIGKQEENTSCFPVFTSLFFFCMAAPVAVWTIGGLEQPLYAALIALSIPLIVQMIESDKPEKQTLLFLSFILGLLCLTRPDGPLFSVAACFSLYIGRYAAGKEKLSFANLFTFVSMPLFLCISQLGFRFYYYGEFVPNTALVKIAPSMHHISNGAKYMATGILALFPFSFLAIISMVIIVFKPARRSLGLSLLMICVFWVPYIIFVGGDIFPAFRHLIPLTVVFAFALAEGTEIALKKIAHPMLFKHKILLLFTLVTVFSSYLFIQFSNPENKRALDERWEWDGKVTGLLLRQAFAQQKPLVAVTAAGCLPYWSQLPALDMLGLNDYYLPRNPPADFGKGVIGHELGDGKYILQNKPDIVVFHTGILHAIFRSGVEMQQTKEFYELYTPVKVLGKTPHEYLATIWFNKYSPKIGIRNFSTSTLIPAYLLNGNPETVAYLNNAGRLVISVNASQPASISIVSPGYDNSKVLIKPSKSQEIEHVVETAGSLILIRLSSQSIEPVEIEEVILEKS